jgi:hypothetical protein
MIVLVRHDPRTVSRPQRMVHLEKGLLVEPASA